MIMNPEPKRETVNNKLFQSTIITSQALSQLFNFYWGWEFVRC